MIDDELAYDIPHLETELLRLTTLTEEHTIRAALAMHGRDRETRSIHVPEEQESNTLEVGREQ